MLFKSEKPVVLVALSSYVIQSGTRKGEVVNRCSVSDGTQILENVNLGDKVDVTGLKLYTQPYDIGFDYSIGQFDSRVFTNVRIVGFVPCK